MYLDIPLRTIIGLRHPDDGTKPGSEKRVAKLWPTQGKLYLAGVRTFVDEDIDLTVSILHPRTQEPLNALGGMPLVDVRVVRLNPDFGRNGEPIYAPHVPVLGYNDPSDYEPVYFNKDFPLCVEIVGEHMLHMAVYGCDFYSVDIGASGFPRPAGFRASYLPKFEELRGPCGIPR